MTERKIFKATVREPVEAQIGDEVVDLTSISLKTVTEVIALVGRDATKIGAGNFDNVVAAVAKVCEPSNANVTAEYLYGLDAFEEVIPFMQYVMGIVNERSQGIVGMVDPKNPSPSSMS